MKAKIAALPSSEHSWLSTKSRRSLSENATADAVAKYWSESSAMVSCCCTTCRHVFVTGPDHVQSGAGSQASRVRPMHPGYAAFADTRTSGELAMVVLQSVCAM